MSPDNTIMQVPPVWLRWLHQHLGVTHEWCTSWYGMGRVMGVSSRLVGSPPESLIGGGVERAWDYQVGKDQRGESAHGVVMLRGWARTGHRAPGGQREGYIAPLFQHMVRELAAADKHQYMFVAVHEEGQETIEKALKEVQAQVMLKVPDGRMGHREAWWPLDKFVDNANDWADQRRELPNPRKEAVWLVRLGHGQWGQEAKVGSDRQLALEQLEDLGTRYVAGGLKGLQLRWGKQDKGVVCLGEDRAYLQRIGEVLGLVAARPAEQTVQQIQDDAGMDVERVLQSTQQGDTTVERTLGAEVKLFREEDQERCGVE